MPKKVLTICILHKHPHVLLGMKKRGFGKGKWNGFGGKVEAGETIEEAMHREVKEEAGITLGYLEKMGVIDFEFKGNPELLETHIFRSTDFSGEPTESDEMRPRWFHVDDIPFRTMWVDDEMWFPLVLSGKKFKAKFLFGDNEDILDHSLTEHDNLA